MWDILACEKLDHRILHEQYPTDVPAWVAQSAGNVLRNVSLQLPVFYQNALLMFSSSIQVRLSKMKSAIVLGFALGLASANINFNERLKLSCRYGIMEPVEGITGCLRGYACQSDGTYEKYILNID